VHQIAGANAGWRWQFRFAARGFWSGGGSAFFARRLMINVPVLLAITGVAFMVSELRAFIFILSCLMDDRLSLRWGRWWIVAFVVGILLALSIIWCSYPFDGGWAAGIPFLLVWFDKAGADYICDFWWLTLPGNLLFWFLAPQLVFAYIAHRYLRLHEDSHTTAF
jgi:hypothetical protein